jgi:hypothetical protein
VALWAPWAFGLATTSFAVLPPLVTAGVSAPVAYTGLIAGVAMLTGTFVQPWAGRLPASARITPPVYALCTAALGMGAAVVVVTTQAVWFLVPTAMVLGTAYGIMMVSGLREVQRIAAPEELGTLTAVFYALTYLGFFVPLRHRPGGAGGRVRHRVRRRCGGVPVVRGRDLPSQPPVLIGEGHRLEAVGRPGLADHRGQVVAHRALRQVQCGGDLADAGPAAGGAADLHLPVGQG